MSAEGFYPSRLEEFTGLFAVNCGSILGLGALNQIRYANTKCCRQFLHQIKPGSSPSTLHFRHVGCGHLGSPGEYFPCGKRRGRLRRYSPFRVRCDRKLLQTDVAADSLFSMGKRNESPEECPSVTAPRTNGVGRERGPNGTFRPGPPRSVTLEGVTLEGIYAELQTAYRSPVASHEPVSLTRWRKLFTKSPAEFLRIMKAEEDRWRASQEAAVRHQAEFERLIKREKELEESIRLAEERMAELEAKLSKLGEDEDECAACLAHPNSQRIEELMNRLVKWTEICPQCKQEVNEVLIVEGRCVGCWIALAKNVKPKE